MIQSPREGLWSPIDPDAYTYGIWGQQILSHGITAYTNASRVPLWPLTIVPFYALFGVSNLTIRLASFFFGILTIFVTYKVAKEAFGHRVGFIASSLLATSFYVVFDALRGLREELFSFLLLCLIYFALVRPKSARVNFAVSAILTVLLYFTRSDGALLVVPIMMIYLVANSIGRKEKIPVRKIALITLSLALSIWAWAWFSFTMTGDPFQESTTYAMWNYWVEIQGAPVGTAPIVHVTIMEYLFKYHTLSQLMFASGKGTLWIIQFLDLQYYPYFFAYLPSASPLALAISPVVPILIFSGALISWRQRGNWYFPLLYAMVLPYLGMFHQLGVLETIRALVPFAPILFITIAISLDRLYKALLLRLGGISFIKNLALWGFLGSLTFSYLFINYDYLLDWAILKWNAIDSIGVSVVASLCLLWMALRVLGR